MAILVPIPKISFLTNPFKTEVTLTNTLNTHKFYIATRSLRLAFLSLVLATKRHVTHFTYYLFRICLPNVNRDIFIHGKTQHLESI